MSQRRLWKLASLCSDTSDYPTRSEHYPITIPNIDPSTVGWTVAHTLGRGFTSSTFRRVDTNDVRLPALNITLADHGGHRESIFVVWAFTTWPRTPSTRVRDRHAAWNKSWTIVIRHPVTLTLPCVTPSWTWTSQQARFTRKITFAMRNRPLWHGSRKDSSTSNGTDGTSSREGFHRRQRVCARWRDHS